MFRRLVHRLFPRPELLYGGALEAGKPGMRDVYVKVRNAWWVWNGTRRHWVWPAAPSVLKLQVPADGHLVLRGWSSLEVPVTALHDLAVEVDRRPPRVPLRPDRVAVALDVPPALVFEAPCSTPMARPERLRPLLNTVRLRPRLPQHRSLTTTNLDTPKLS